MKRLKPRTPPGTPVWFRPIDEDALLAAVTDDFPYKIGQRFVVDIHEVTPTYSVPTGRIKSVAFTFLSLRDEVTTSCAPSQ